MSTIKIFCKYKEVRAVVGEKQSSVVVGEFPIFNNVGNTIDFLK